MGNKAFSGHHAGHGASSWSAAEFMDLFNDEHHVCQTEKYLKVTYALFLFYLRLHKYMVMCVCVCVCVCV